MKRWSSKEIKKVDVPCPIIVQHYNKHMGGVDLCDMLLSLYRICLGTHKWYMHIVYYCLGISVVNGWLLYRRHSEQKHIDNKNVMSLLKFQSQVANALIKSGKAPAKIKRCRPSSSSPVVERPQKHHSAAAAVPCNDIKKDQVGHFQIFIDKQQCCRFCPKGFTKIQCSKCHINLCLMKDRSCFYEFHN